MITPSIYETTPTGPPVIFVVGPTASGKTDLSLEIGTSIPSEIINADSRQIYSHMGIGTGWPAVSQIQAVPHHLLGFLDPTKRYSLSEFLTAARGAISSIHEQSKLPIVVGGTGQYIWALVEGWEPPMVPPESEIRDRLQRVIGSKGVEHLHSELRKVDPEGARIVSPSNGRRIIRALEVWETTGIRFSEQRRKQRPSFSPTIVGIQTNDNRLQARISRRIQRMLDDGWIQEVSSLMEMGVRDDSAAFSSAGYRAIASYLERQLTFEEMRILIGAATRRLARRQKAWFRFKDPRISWWESTASRQRLVAEILQLPSLISK